MRHLRTSLAGILSTRWGWFAVAFLTIIFLGLALWNLGSSQLPDSNWSPDYNGEDVRIDLGTKQQVSDVYVLIQEARPVTVEAYCEEEGRWFFSDQFTEEGTYRQWRRLRLDCETRYIRLQFIETDVEIGEVAVFNDSRKLEIERVITEQYEPIGVALIDEQDMIEAPPTFKDGTYFDEIYFVRTAEEHLNIQEPFERTHPPLSKLIIALGILLFGNNPFAWRILGVVFATLMIPLVYAFAKRMFGGVGAGVIAAALITFDFMHFTEARLATGETFILFFVILMFYFFYRFYQDPDTNSKSLFFCALFFGIGFTVKWTTAFGFVAILILFAFMIWKRRVHRTNIINMAVGLGVAAIVYLASYTPYFLVGHGIGDFIDLQFSAFEYHATLEDSHPYTSPWWSWPLMIRPIALYANQLNDLSALIASLGNPILWWGSIPFVLFTTWLAVKRRDKTAVFILVSFLAQWLLFVPISRALFIYHFYPNVLFMVLTTSLGLTRLQSRWRWSIVPYFALLVILFICLFPVISGLPVLHEYWDILRKIVGNQA